jgi:hypothetical protein
LEHWCRRQRHLQSFKCYVFRRRPTESVTLEKLSQWHGNVTI